MNLDWVTSMQANTIQLRGPYDFARSIGFWQRSTLELCEQWADGVYRRVVVLEAQPCILGLHNAGTVEAPAVVVEVDGQAADMNQIAALEPTIRSLLGDDLDLRAFYSAVANDQTMAMVTRELYGIRAPRSPLWETLCWVIIGQQISLPFARMLKTRLVAHYAEAFMVADRPLYLFPPPERLAEADSTDMLAMQFSRNKASFIIGLAQSIVDGALDLEYAAQLATEAAVEYLVSFRGIGRWTAEFTLMRALGRRDALPANDAGVRQAITALYGEKLPEPALRAFATRWEPWGGAVAMYLLAWLKENDKAIKR